MRFPLIATFLLVGAVASATQAQPYPSKPVHVIVPYPLKADRANAKQVIARTGIRLEDSPTR